MNSVNSEQDKIDFDTADVWRTAQQRRADDLSRWLGIFLEKRRLKAEAEDVARASPGQPRLA